MIAPLRETESSLDESARVMARARRAVATALLRQQPTVRPAAKAADWKAWLFAGWTVVVTVASLGGAIMGWWKGIDY
jgi:hypothetical protein